MEYGKSSNLKPNPYGKAHIISKTYFCWLNRLFWKGRKYEFDLDSLYNVLPQDSSAELGARLSKAWEEEVDRTKEYNEKLKKTKSNKKPKKPNLGWTLVREFRLVYLLFGILPFIEECFVRIAQPLILGYLIQYFNGKLSYRDGHILAALTVVTSIIYATVHHPYFFHMQYIGMKLRIACCSLIYRKALRLSQASLAQTTIGQMVNLLSNDVNRFDQTTIFLNYLWIAPIQAGIATWILWNYFGPSCFVGLGILLLLIPFQGYFGKLYSDYRAETANRTDIRIRLMNEILNGMRVIKLYCWEKVFFYHVNEARKNEIAIIKRASNIRSINIGIFYVASKLMVFLTLLCYVLTGHTLTAEKVFVTLALYNNIRPVSLFFIYAIGNLAEAKVSTRRIEEFLLMEEKPTNMQISESESSDFFSVNSEDQPPYLPSPSIQFNQFYAKWNPNAQDHTLSNITASFGPRQLVCLVGSIGSGKGSFLSACLKELPAISGSVTVNGTTAYTSQEPWVFAGTVQDNIIFGGVFDDAWYKEVISACALAKDIQSLPFGDLTYVGDKGASLSGGQKARISLARAVYADADIYLLDDPLSAVDSEVGKHIFHYCINGLLRPKLVLLVTHQLQFLRKANRIIFLNNGTIQMDGTYAEIIAKGSYYSDLLLRLENQDVAALTRGKSVNSRISTSGDYEPVAPTATPRTPHLGNSKSSSVHSFILRHRGSNHPIENSMLVDGTNPEVEVVQVNTVSEGGDRSIVQGTSMVQEETSTGSIECKSYWEYFHSGSNCFLFLAVIFTNLITQALFTGSDFWLNIWTNHEEKHSTDHSKESKKSRKNLLIVYSAIIAALASFSILRVVVFFQVCMQASVKFHRKMLYGVIRSPMSFFEKNLVGRILNRFSKDIGQMDDALPSAFFDALAISLLVLGSVVIIAVINPYVLVPAFALLIVFYFLRRYYIGTARNIKRLEGIARSPVFSHLSTSLYGLTTIRAFQAEEQFIRQFDAHHDMHSASWFLYIASTRWFAVWLDWISILFITAVIYCFMVFPIVSNGSSIGLALSSALTLTGLFQWGVRQSAEVENQMVSVERILEYTKLPSEAPLKSKPSQGPPLYWPSHGEIIFKSVSLMYNKNAITLTNINCNINPAEKIGIVGRTGSGKSSLINALFRIVEPTGSIEIDGVNTLAIGLFDLRNKISIIPQDPVLFEGTLRSNFDPYEIYTDMDIWTVLKEISLYDEIKSFTAGLNLEVTEGGNNFSLGQKQLICLGRAILRRNKILVLDEATANVDMETDSFIQNTIRRVFGNCTILTVAHRLNTIMDSDRIMVLSHGKILEFDHPWILLQNKRGALYHLAEETGHSSLQTLLNVAKANWEKRQIQAR